MAQPYVTVDGFHIDDAYNTILCIYVDFRDPDDRMPVTTLIKGCEQRYALEKCKKIRLSKPSRFREFGEGLVQDSFEAKASRSEIREAINDPEDLVKAQTINDEMVQASRWLQYPIKLQTHRTRTRSTKTVSLSTDKNGWIFCTSIEPKNQEEYNEWQQSLDDRYDHVTRIYRPREFARALGSMVAEQLGPQGSEDVMKHGIGDHKFKTVHKTQIVYHGPVIYEKEPYGRALSASTPLESITLPIFAKRIQYGAQQEYRFLVVTKEEPSDVTVDLDVSLAMLGSLKERPETTIPRNLPTIISFEEDSEFSDTHPESDVEATRHTEPHHGIQDDNISNFPIPDNFLNSPSIPISTHARGVEDVPPNLDEMLTTYTAIETLRYVIGGPLGTGRIPRKRYVAAASSAWHADQCIRLLCVRFEDPIKNISVNDGNFIVIEINFSSESGSKGKVLVGPHGTVTHNIKSESRFIHGISKKTWVLPSDVPNEFEEMGLRVRKS